MQDTCKREPEKEFGNIEYKSSLVCKSQDRIQGIASQMRFTVDQGKERLFMVLEFLIVVLLVLQTNLQKVLIIYVWLLGRIIIVLLY